MQPTSSARDFDLIVHGATGFTGRQAADYVFRHAPEGLRWAISGRNRAKLDAVAASLGGAAVVVADAHDAIAIDALARRTRVVLTTVGPYAKYGTALVAACAAHGTHYVDITGETPWVRDMIDVHQATAERSGAVIVPMCGFDSVPSDLGTYMMVRWLREERGVGTREVRSGFRMKGGLNGGTLDSALTAGEQGVQRKMGHPFLLNPEGTRGGPGRVDARHADPTGPWHDAQLGPEGEGGRWLAPFFMAPVNTRVVRRSAAVWEQWGRPYGTDFAYREGMRVRGRMQGLGVTFGLVAGFGLLSTRAGRSLARRLLPAPGEGPSEAVMDGGFFTGELVAVGEDGSVVRGRVHAQGDPGNRNTIKMLAECAFCLTSEWSRLPVAEHGGGIWTPATALGDPLLQRLRAAGMTWEVLG
jgi:short subunit dehydrogenase-like uncharacterized protein